MENKIREKYNTEEWFEFFYDIAEYGNENWKGSFSAREIAKTAYTYLYEFVESMVQGKFTHTMNELHRLLCRDWNNASFDAMEFVTEIDLALNNALQMKGDNHE